MVRLVLGTQAGGSDAALCAGSAHTDRGRVRQQRGVHPRLGRKVRRRAEHRAELSQPEAGDRQRGTASTRRGSVPKLDDAGVRELRAVVDEKNDRTLDEIARELDQRRNVRVGRTTVWRILDRMGLTRKKKRNTPRNRIGPKSRRSRRPSGRRSSRSSRRACSISTSSASA